MESTSRICDKNLLPNPCNKRFTFRKNFSRITVDEMHYKDQNKIEIPSKLAFYLKPYHKPPPTPTPQITWIFTSPWLAPLTSPAISTNSMDAGTARWDLLSSESTWRRGSGTATIPTFGSIVQKGKLAACAFPFSTYNI